MRLTGIEACQLEIKKTLLVGRKQIKKQSERPSIYTPYQVNIINAGFNSTGSAKCDTTVAASG